MSGADVVAVVLSWNDADHVIALLDRLAALQPSPGHVVVVDNGSTDGSADRIAGAFPNHQLVRLHANVGFATAARNDCKPIVKKATATTTSPEKRKIASPRSIR